MADTQQGLRQQGARDAAGTLETYDGDLRALFEAQATIPPGSTFNEAFILWLQDATGSSEGNVNDLAQLFVEQTAPGTYNWSSLGELALPTLFTWNPETAQALPGTSTFTRASIAQVLTTTDGTTNWYQEAKSGELRLDGLRRVENLVAEQDDTAWTLTGSATILSLGGGEYRVTCPATTNAGAFGTGVASTAELSGFPIIGSAEIRLVSGGPTLQMVDPALTSTEARTVTLTSSYQKFQWNPKASDADGGSNPGLWLRTPSATALVFEFKSPQLQKAQSTSDVATSPYVDNQVTYNADVDGVRYFNTTNGNSVDGSGVVTEATGTTITGGGYLPEPAATNRMLDSNDMTQASWTASGAATPADLGVTDIGAQSTRVSGLGALAVDDIEQAASGFTASGAVAPSLSLRRVSTTGILRIINSTGAANGEWQVDLSLIGADWVQLADAGSTSPIVTGGAPVSSVADSLTDAAWPATASSVIDTTVAGVTIPGFSEVTPWVADGGGNAGVLFHAAAGGPLTVDIAFNMLENSAGVEMRMLGFGDNTAYSFRIDLPTVARIATGGINSFITAASSYEGERHGFGMSFQVNEGIVVDDEDNDNTDVTGTPGGGTIQIGLNSALAGVPGRYHRVRIAPVPQTVDELKALV